VDHPRGVTLGDCRVLSRELGYLLEGESGFEERYSLEVSSPGLDRELGAEREREACRPAHEFAPGVEGRQTGEHGGAASLSGADHSSGARRPSRQRPAMVELGFSGRRGGSDLPRAGRRVLVGTGQCGRTSSGDERRIHPACDQSIRGPGWRLTYAAMIKATTTASTAISRAYR